MKNQLSSFEAFEFIETVLGAARDWRYEPGQVEYTPKKSTVDLKRTDRSCRNDDIYLTIQLQSRFEDILDVDVTTTRDATLVDLIFETEDHTISVWYQKP